MRMEIDAARLLVWRAAWMGRNNQPFTAGEGSMSKLKAGEVAVAVTEKAVQILGGAGYLRDHPVERWYRDAKIYTIFEGTSRDPAPGHRPRHQRRPHPLTRSNPGSTVERPHFVASAHVERPVPVSENWPLEQRRDPATRGLSTVEGRVSRSGCRLDKVEPRARRPG